MISYYLPKEYGSLLRFDDSVIDHFLKHRQLKSTDPEAGGQLFAEINKDLIFVRNATGPHTEDKRSWFRFSPSISVEQKEIHEYFVDQGLHYFGDWHTHPEQMPTPSGLDMKAIKKTLSSGGNDIFGILMVIVGESNPPSGMYVALQTESGLNKLLVIE